jgi:kinesin family protein 6/9
MRRRILADASCPILILRSPPQYINLSLSFLEQVIIALQERSLGLKRGHVPYRNSTLTSVLRDSLGGNCRTAMVATVQPVATQIEESIATCRFAQRVAMISNKVQVNEEVDAAAVIRRLKGEVRELNEEARLRYALVWENTLSAMRFAMHASSAFSR